MSVTLEQMSAAFAQMVEVQKANFDLQTKLLEKMTETKGGGTEGTWKERKSGERLNCKAMTAVDKFKGGEVEWVDWKFRFLNAIGTGSMAMRRVLTWAEENAGKGEAMTARRAVDGLENVPGQGGEDSINDTFRGMEGMSGEVYSYLVTATTDEALGVVKAVTSGDGVEAWTELHKRYNQRTMSRMMRVLMDCMYPREVRVVELGGPYFNGRASGAR